MFNENFVGGLAKWSKKKINNEFIMDEIRRKKRQMNASVPPKRVPERSWYDFMRQKWKPDDSVLDEEFVNAEDFQLFVCIETFAMIATVECRHAASSTL